MLFLARVAFFEAELSSTEVNCGAGSAAASSCLAASIIRPARMAPNPGTATSFSGVLSAMPRSVLKPCAARLSAVAGPIPGISDMDLFTVTSPGKLLKGLTY